MMSLNMNIRLKEDKGVTLIELLIALVISGVLIAALYRTFIGQQKTYIVQDQVVDMQQNVRVAINKMMREIRMAGFGNFSNLLPLDAHNDPSNKFNNIINPSDNKNNVGQNDDQITIVGAFEQVSTLAAAAATGTNSILLNGNGSEFDTGYKKYICIGGLETHTVSNVTGNTITFNGNLINNYSVGAPVFKVKAITYRLRWDNDIPTMPVLAREDNTDGGGKSWALAENIENPQFTYLGANGVETAIPGDIRMVRLTVIARTSMSDPDFKGGVGGFRRRTIASNIQIRNMGVNP